MSTASEEYDKKFMNALRVILPVAGAFMLLSQMVGLVVAFAHYNTWPKLEAVYVKRVPFSVGFKNSMPDCYHYYKVQRDGVEKELTVLSDCRFVFGGPGAEGAKVTLAIDPGNADKALSQASFGLGWLKLLIITVGFICLIAGAILHRKKF